ncbi:hypothetical protein TWF718_009039 [Orbilia javanica]|uniref:Uncharacterized protein n=1 Tax=Orbilia javanica TaxID=47235 RepID=A0AAN8MLM8_9PEZI
MAARSFSPIADLVVELLAKPENKLFLVSSAILRTVSPVWRKALDPNSGFAPLDKITVDGVEYSKTTIEGIGGTPLIYVLDILHHRTGSTPRSITFRSLRDIAILADQYDFANSLAPWPQFWIEWLTTGKTEHLEVGYEDWLFIANVFAEVPICKKIVSSVAEELVLDLIISTSSGPGGAVTCRYSRSKSPFGQSLNLSLVPEKILKSIKKERLDKLSKVILPLWSFTQSMINTSASSTTVAAAVQCRNPDCFAIALGSLLRSINSGCLKNSLIATRMEIPTGNSLRETMKAIENLRMTTLILERTPGVPAGQRHQPGLFDTASKPTHDSNGMARLESFKSLIRDLPEYVFLRNQDESTTKYSSGRFETCPLARHFTSLQREAIATLSSVVGYTATAD